MMSTAQTKIVETFFRLTQLPSQTAAINAALRLGVVDALSGGQMSAEQIAHRCGLNAAGVAALLVVLRDIGMVERYGQEYALSSAARMIPKSVWGALFQQWISLEPALLERTETSPASSADDSDGAVTSRDANTAHDDQFFRLYQAHTQWSSTPSALKTADALGIGIERTGLRVLDLGCGAAIYSMTIAHRDPQARITLVDDAEGLAQAYSTVESLALSERVTEVESSSLLPEDIDHPFDLVLVAEGLPTLDQDRRQSVFEYAFRVLRPGGELAVIDAFAGQERGEIAYSIHQLLVMIASGNILPTLEVLQRELSECRFEQIQFTHLPAPPFIRGLVLASKPQNVAR